MSGAATGWVLRNGPRPEHLDRTGRRYGQRARGMRAVLVTIADAANRDGEHAHPGLAAMMEGALYSRNQVIDIAKTLVDEGWVGVQQHGGGRGVATEYRLQMVQPPHCLAGGNSPVCEEKQSSLDPETVQSAPETVQSRLDPNGVTTELPTVENNAAGTEVPEGDAASVADPPEPATATARTATPRGEAKRAKDQARAEAELLVRAWWEERAAAGNPVGQPWIACVGVVATMLRQGVAGSRIEWALRNAPVVSTAALEMAIQRRLNGQNGHPSRGPTTGNHVEVAMRVREKLLAQEREASHG